MNAARRIGILAGGGTLPREIADAVAARGIPLHIVTLDGESDADFGPYPVTSVNWGEIGRMVETFKETGCTDLVIIGAVTRPDLGTIKPDMGFVRAAGTVLGLVLAGGDDAVLRGVIRFFEGHGFRVAGPAQVAPELVVGKGAFTADAFDRSMLRDAQMGFHAIAALGGFDIGQAAVVCDGRLEALEAAEGTDRMLERLALQRRAGATIPARSAGVLVKRTKPGQDLRIDLPVIGPNTITRAIEAGLGGIAVEAGRTLAASRAELLARAAASRLAVAGFDVGDSQSAYATKPGGRPSWTARALGAMRSRRAAGTMQTQALGRYPIPRRALHDAKTGLDILAALRPLGGSRAVVVVRGHVLAVETGEGAAMTLARAAELRQWGDRRLRRRSGTMVVEAGRDCVPELVESAVRGRFAGLVAKLRRFAAGVPSQTIEAADKAGIFIVGVPTDDEEQHG